MATQKEIEKQLRESKKKNREKDKIIEEHETHIKFLHDRLKLAKDDLFDERQKRLNMTVDEVLLKQKAKADYALSIEKSMTDQLEKQEQVKLNTTGISDAVTI